MDTRKLGGWLRRIKDRLIGAGARRFVLWSGSVLLAIMLNTILYTQKIVSPDAFTDALIAIITIAPYLYQYSIYVSILIIEVPKDRVLGSPYLW